MLVRVLAIDISYVGLGRRLVLSLLQSLLLYLYAARHLALPIAVLHSKGHRRLPCRPHEFILSLKLRSFGAWGKWHILNTVHFAIKELAVQLLLLSLLMSKGCRVSVRFSRDGKGMELRHGRIVLRHGLRREKLALVPLFLLLLFATQLLLDLSSEEFDLPHDLLQLLFGLTLHLCHSLF